MNSHINHTLSHLQCHRSYDFEFTNMKSKFEWVVGDSFVREITSGHDPAKLIDVSEVSQTGSVEVTLKKVIKKVCRVKTEEEHAALNQHGNSL